MDVADGRAGREEGTGTQSRAEAEMEGQQDGADGLAQAAGAGRCSVRQEDVALPVQAAVTAAQLPGHRLGSSQDPVALPSHGCEEQPRD